VHQVGLLSRPRSGPFPPSYLVRLLRSRQDRRWAQRSYYKVNYFNEVDKGGHFAAWESPELFATEICAAFRSLR
jgi:pimeloyl-ACP methyl ester carboxylesterase